MGKEPANSVLLIVIESLSIDCNLKMIMHVNTKNYAYMYSCDALGWHVQCTQKVSSATNQHSLTMTLLINYLFLNKCMDFVVFVLSLIITQIVLPMWNPYPAQPSQHVRGLSANPSRHHRRHPQAGGHLLLQSM